MPATGLSAMHRRFTLWKMLALLSASLLTGCLGYPETVNPVTGFELKRYLGKWYEVARLDHKFERGLDSVSAEYSLREDGGVEESFGLIMVLNGLG